MGFLYATCRDLVELVVHTIPAASVASQENDYQAARAAIRMNFANQTARP